LENINIPFGVETYEKKNIVNIEIVPKRNNLQYNYYAIISHFEKEMTDKNNFKYEKLSRDIENKGYYPNMRESKQGYILRTHIFNTPEVFSMVSGKNKNIKDIKDKRSLLDIGGVRANVEIELGTLWVTENNYGYLWYIKKIEILHLL